MATNRKEFILKKVYMRYDGTRLVKFTAPPKYPNNKCFTATFLLDKSNPAHQEAYNTLSKHIEEERKLAGGSRKFRASLLDCSNLPLEYTPDPEELIKFWRLTTKAKPFDESPSSIKAKKPIIFDRFGREMSEDYIIPAGACVTVKVRAFTYKTNEGGVTFEPIAVVVYDSEEPLSIPMTSYSINAEEEREAMLKFFDETSEMTDEEFDELVKY